MVLCEMGLRLKMLLILFSTTVQSFVASGQIARLSCFFAQIDRTRRINLLLKVRIESVLILQYHFRQHALLHNYNSKIYSAVNLCKNRAI